jgi:1,2-diacylglycerol 3-alpha-glucosyltransferase
MFSRLDGEINNLKLLIVGKGPYLNNLKELTKAKNLEDKVIFTGVVNPSEVYKYYKISDAFVTASTSETQGLTYIEALSSGLPVICRYDTCIEGVVETGINGFVYQNEEEFRTAVKALFSSEEYRHTIAQKAELAADKFSSRAFATKVEELYRSVLNESGNISAQFSA